MGGDPSRFGVTPEQFHESIAARRRAGVAMLATYSVFGSGRSDEGLPKLYVVARALEIRRRHPSLFVSDASYEPLFARGARADHVVAFARAERPSRSRLDS